MSFIHFLLSIFQYQAISSLEGPRMIWDSHNSGYKEFCLLRFNARICLPPAFMVVSCLAYSSTLKMEAICSFERSVDLQPTKRRYNPEDRTILVRLVAISYMWKLRIPIQNVKDAGVICGQYSRFWELRFSRRWLRRVLSSGIWRRVVR
jgi:hypothetical protein